MGKFKYTSIDRLLAKLDRDLGLVSSGIGEGHVIEWVGEALEAIGCVQQYEEAVAFIEVANHQCVLPQNFHAIVQVAKNNCWVKQDKQATGLCASNVAVVAPTGAVTCPVVLDCDGCPIQEYELAYYRPYFDLQYEYYGWTSKLAYKACFSPVRLSTNTFSSLVCTEQDDTIRQLYQSCSHEYTIIAGEMLRFNFCDGQIALSYLRQQVDSITGYPMIPDHFSFLEAVTSYVTMKKCKRDFYTGREGSSGRLQKAEDDWNWYCGQASNLFKMPQGLDEHQNMLEQRNYLIPRLGDFYGFFGRLGKAEDRKFNHSNGR